MSSRLGVALSLAFSTLAFATNLRAQGDPRFHWRTIDTPHFSVHFYNDLEPVARRVAVVAEGAYERLRVPMGYSPTQRTQIVLRDTTDDANGSATSVPFNTINLFVTAPDDLSVLNQYDDWISTLVTHEFTHVLHADNITGLAAIVNTVLGKQWSPNQVQPRFILEGLAVYEESLHTRGGRLRSALWDMQLRADALEGNLATLDQLASGANRWPHGNLWYLYGSSLFQYIAARFGNEAIPALTREYGSMAAPWQLNRAIRRVTGHTWEEIYSDWCDAIRARYALQRRAITAQGLEEGTRVTFQGETVRAPRFLPDGTVIYQSSDNQSHTMLRGLAPQEFLRTGTDRRPRAFELEWEGSPSGFAVIDQNTLVVSDIAPYREMYLYHDLHRWRLSRSRDGSETSRESAVRLTEGWRAQQPDVHPDGDTVVFTVNHRGTSELTEMSLTERNPRVLFRARRFEQVYSPRYSPDGQWVVFSRWVDGQRDLWRIRRRDGRMEALTHDRALDQSPVYSPDGRYLVWSSDRTGVSNLYTRELATGAVRQVTNTVMGAYQPAVSPDGRWIVYVGYTSRGWDLFRLVFDPSRWREPRVEQRDFFDREGSTPPPAPPMSPAARETVSAEATPESETQRAEPSGSGLRSHPYNAWATLRPRSWMLEYGVDGFGPQLAVRSLGADVVGRHSWNLRVGAGLVRGDPLVDATYVYAGVRPTVRVRVYRSVDAGGGYRVSGRDTQWVAERIGGESEISVGFPGVFDAQSLSLSYEAQWVRALGGLPLYQQGIDPNTAPPTVPFEGWVNGLRLSWGYSRVQRYAYSITAQEGFSAFASVRVLDEIFGSAVGGIDLSAAVAVYFPMPWGSGRRRHIVAARLGGGIAMTDAGERGAFALGGFPNFSVQSLIDAFRLGVTNGGIALRGYPPLSRVGSQFQLLNIEYRFPIWQTRRGVSSLPVFIQRVSGDAFVDTGYAGFGPWRVEGVAVGAGLEVLVDVVLGYILPFTVRFGYARGFMTGGIDQTYALFSSPF